VRHLVQGLQIGGTRYRDWYHAPDIVFYVPHDDIHYHLLSDCQPIALAALAR
jgi:hypothetical protein